MAIPSRLIAFLIASSEEKWVAVKVGGALIACAFIPRFFSGEIASLPLFFPAIWGGRVGGGASSSSDSESDGIVKLWRLLLVAAAEVIGTGTRRSLLSPPIGGEELAYIN